MPPGWIGLTLAFVLALVTNTAYSLEHDAAAKLPPLSPRRPFRSVQVLLNTGNDSATGRTPEVMRSRDPEALIGHRCAVEGQSPRKSPAWQMTRMMPTRPDP